MALQSESINEIAGALARAQLNIERAVKDAENPYFNSKYADLASVMTACMKALNAENIAVVQVVEFNGQRPLLVTRLLHNSGQFVESHCPLYIETKCKNAMHALGSAITYARRYSLASICGVAQDDDDGNSAGNVKPDEPAEPEAPEEVRGKKEEITVEEAEHLFALIEGDKAYYDCVFAYIKKADNADRLHQMSRESYTRIFPVAEKKYNERQEYIKAVGE